MDGQFPTESVFGVYQLSHNYNHDVSQTLKLTYYGIIHYNIKTCE